MRKLGFASVAILALVASANAGSLADQLKRELLSDPYQPQPLPQPNVGVGSGLGSGNVKLNAYGHGMGADQFGRAVLHDPLLQVEPNAYGLGVGMDQFGRPVR